MTSLLSSAAVLGSMEERGRDCRGRKAIGAGVGLGDCRGDPDRSPAKRACPGDRASGLDDCYVRRSADKRDAVITACERHARDEPTRFRHARGRVARLRHTSDCAAHFCHARDDPTRFRDARDGAAVHARDAGCCEAGDDPACVHDASAGRARLRPRTRA